MKDGSRWQNETISIVHRFRICILRYITPASYKMRAKSQEAYYCAPHGTEKFWFDHSMILGSNDHELRVLSAIGG